MELKTVSINKPEEVNVIIGQSHFIKTVEDLHEALVTAFANLQDLLSFVTAAVTLS